MARRYKKLRKLGRRGTDLGSKVVAGYLGLMLFAPAVIPGMQPVGVLSAPIGLALLGHATGVKL